MRLGAIEAGGTKFVCATGDEFGNVFDRIVIKTTTPKETIDQVLEWFQAHPVERIGIGSFGPVDLDKNSPTFGSILTSPKLAWRGFNFLQSLAPLQVPLAIDTDVNVCALAESMLGAARDVDSCIYLTVGTGIGGGICIHHQTIKGLQHPEMGHVPVLRHAQDTYAGGCPSHTDCLEGLASGPAIEARFGQPASSLTPDHLAFTIESDYLAQAIYTYALVFSPKRFVLGGGVMHVPGLLKKIRANVKRLNQGYLAKIDDLDNYIVTPGLGDDVGIIGCFLVASQSS
jgi:fructokinase